MSQGSPLIPQGGKFTPDPTYQAQVAKDDNNADYEYWKSVVPHAVDFSKACVTPTDTQEVQQAKLRATLETLTKWMREA